MRDFHLIWIDQCDAAEDIRDAFGLQKALGYLIGEKFLTLDHEQACVVRLSDDVNRV